jgi:hypothetical protein
MPVASLAFTPKAIAQVRPISCACFGAYQASEHSLASAAAKISRNAKALSVQSDICSLIIRERRDRLLPNQFHPSFSILWRCTFLISIKITIHGQPASFPLLKNGRPFSNRSAAVPTFVLAGWAVPADIHVFCRHLPRCHRIDMARIPLKRWQA